jgi:hypothetical protein
MIRICPGLSIEQAPPRVPDHLRPPLPARRGAVVSIGIGEGPVGTIAMPRAKEDMTLGHFVSVAARLGMEDFVRRFREPVLVAMGVLETAEILARCGSTVGVRISTPMTYDRREVHPLAGRVFRLPVESAGAGEIVIGRDAPADVVVPDETVSIRHCAISWVGETVRVSDLGSTNGTLINLKPVRQGGGTPLESEDIVTVGRHSFQFYRPRHFFRVLEGLATPVAP